MEFISAKLDNLKQARKALNVNDKKTEAYIDALTEIVESLCAQVDELRISVEECVELTENTDNNIQCLGASIQNVRELIVGDVGIDTDNYTEAYDGTHPEEEHGHHGHGCHCGECEDDESEDLGVYATFQCAFCEEIFVADGRDLGEYTVCPSCGRHISVAECIIE